MTDNEILELLRKSNPFMSSASPLPYENKNPDLSQLSREVSDEIEQLMREKRRQPGLPLAGLILGEAGSGKTHMLTRILRKLKSSGGKAIFVAVRTFREPATATHHLLSEIFVSLRKIHSDNRTQFDMLMGELLSSYQEHRRNDEYYSNSTDKDMRKYLSLDMPELDKKFLKGLILYLSTMQTNDPIKKDDILNWLSEGLDDDDAMQLGLPLRNFEEASDEKLEQEAEKTLVSLGRILEYSKVLMVVCFDQIEIMKESSQLIAPFGSLIHLLVNNISGALPLCFVSEETWNNTISPVLDDSVLHRLKNNQMSMKTCTVEQARQLIYTKIKSVLDKSIVDKAYRLIMKRMSSAIKPGYSPRAVIQLANKALKGKIDDPMKEIYEEEFKKIQNEESSWPPNAEQLTMALRMWLESKENVKFAESRARHLRLTGILNDEIKFAFVIIAVSNNASALAGARRAVEFLNENPNALVYYITETQIHRDTWRRANEQLDILKTKGGHVVMLDENSRIKWYALTALINRVDNGDVNLYLQSGNRIATRDDIRDFMKSIKLLELDEVTENKPHTTEQTSSPSYLLSEDAVKALKEIIKTSTMGITSMTKIINLMQEKNFKIDPAQISRFIQGNPDIFKVFPSKDNEKLVGLI